MIGSKTGQQSYMDDAHAMGEGWLLQGAIELSPLNVQNTLPLNMEKSRKRKWVVWKRNLT